MHNKDKIPNRELVITKEMITKDFFQEQFKDIE